MKYVYVLLAFGFFAAGIGIIGRGMHLYAHPIRHLPYAPQVLGITGIIIFAIGVAAFFLSLTRAKEDRKRIRSSVRFQAAA